MTNRHLQLEKPENPIWGEPFIFSFLEVFLVICMDDLTCSLKLLTVSLCGLIVEVPDSYNKCFTCMTYFIIRQLHADDQCPDVGMAK